MAIEATKVGLEHGDHNTTAGKAVKAGVEQDPAKVKLNVESATKTLSQGLSSGDKIGFDADNDGQYKGKSLNLGEGGRSAMMQDRIALELVNKGYSLDTAKAIAKKQTYAHGMKKYGPEQMKKWSQSE